MEEVWMVFTEVNGYRNFHGSEAYLDKAKAEEAARKASAGRKYDDVYVVGFHLNGEEA